MKILFTPYGGGSIAHVVRSLAVADALREKGHEILFTSPTGRKSFIEGAGYSVFGDGHPEVNLNDEHDQSIHYFKDHRQDFIKWLRDEEEAARFFEPDIIVNSPTFFGPTVAMKLGIPHISIINAQWIPEFHGLFGLSFSKKHFGHTLSRFIGKPILASRFDAIYMKEITSFYQELNIPWVPTMRKQLHANNPILIPGIKEFEPIKATKRTDIHYIGPLFWKGFEKEEFHPGSLWPDFRKKPFIYISLGGSIFRKQSYIELVRTAAKYSQWNILVTLGPNISPSELGNFGPHLVIKSYAPGLKVCRYADIVINTGGHGTVMQALWHGKPVIALPHNIDQSTIANRLVELGLGKNMNPITLSGFTDREAYFRSATSISWESVFQATSAALLDSKMRIKANMFKECMRLHNQAPELAAHFIKLYANDRAKDRLSVETESVLV